ncbi:PD-(D/E)XK nuclease-like domain-containing protein [Nocardia sp. CA-290969]|uniref:PD-(D/E)XK nuclease-like domain-containing protein n=1 Tax=Nocardia sp. CA-290969 TaxID=3239986 RepID=UPI003D93D05F
MTEWNDICPTTDLDRGACWHCKAKAAPALVAPTEPGLYPDLPEDIYHSDPNSLSSTGVRLLVKPGGPAKLRYGVHEDNDDFDIGTAAHTLLLGTGTGIKVVEAATWQGKEAKIARAQARAEGKVPLLRKQYNATRAMVDAALARPEVAALFPREENCAAEMSAYALDLDTWVMLRARFDYIIFLPGKRVRVRDYKTSKDAAPKPFEKGAANLGYYVQVAHYIRVLKLLGYTVEEFILLAQEKTEPYLTSLHEFDAEAIAAGDEIVSAAAKLFAECSDFDQWPGYGNQINQMSLPRWAREW